MRLKLALVLGLAAAALPVNAASAVCVPAWELVVGQCSPCTTAGAVFNRIEEKTPVELSMDCLA